MKFILIVILLVAQASFAELKNESEAGLAVVSGNANTENYTFKQQNSYAFGEFDLVKGQGRYVQGRNNGVESARAWDASLRYERTLSPLWTVFAAHTVESDVFGGYVQRDSTDLGGKYTFFKEEETQLFAELGYRYQTFQFVRQVPGADTSTSSARAYAEYNQSLSKTSAAKLWVEYIPTFRDSDAYFINAEPSLTAILTEVLSLKTSYLMKYQNPSKSNRGLKAYTDTTFLTTLVAKF